MIFAGLSLAQLAAIFGAAGFGVVVLYILKLRRRIVAVPFSPLWERILRDKDATTLFSKLKRLLSLLLQLAVLALLVLALGDPRAAESLLKGRTVVVLVDASASMQARDVSPDRLAVAKDEVRNIVRGLGGADRMLVAQMDAMVTPLGPMTSDTSALERELDSVHATDARADFPRALRFASDVLRGQRGRRDRRRIRRRPRRRRGLLGARAPRRHEALVRAGRQGREQRGDHPVLGPTLSARQEPLRGDARAHQHGSGARGRRAPAPRRRRARRSDQAAPAAGRAPAAILPPALRREPHARGEDRAGRRHTGRPACRRPRVRASPRTPARAGARRQRGQHLPRRPLSCSTSTSTSPTSPRARTPRRSPEATGTLSSSIG